MSYGQGLLIEAADFNTFRDAVDEVYGVGNGDSGYGQSAITLPTVAGGTVELIKSVEWTALRNAIGTVASHQGTLVNIPPASELEVAKIVKAYDSSHPSYNIPDAITDIAANRLIADAGSLSTTFDALISTRNTAWATSVSHVFTATFTTEDEARYFFNSGGRIELRASRTGGSATTQNAAWTSLLTGIGSIRMGASSTVSSNAVGTGSAIGYYGLTGTYQTIYTANYTGGSTAYAANSYTVEARVDDGVIPAGSNNDNGRFLRLRILFNDAHSNIYADSVDGTLTSNVDLTRGTSFLSINPPALATTTALSV